MKPPLEARALVGGEAKGADLRKAFAASKNAGLEAAPGAAQASPIDDAMGRGA